MSFPNGLTITNKGRILQAKAQTGIQLNFTKIQIGNGELSGQLPGDMAALVSPKKDISITSLIPKAAGTTSVTGYFNNIGITTGFYYKEIGIFATDPDAGEILYCYGNAGVAAEYIPAEGSAPLERYISIIVIIGNASNVTATIDSSLVYTSQPDFLSHKNDAIIHLTSADRTKYNSAYDKVVAIENLTETTETLTINSLGSFTAAVKNGQLNVLNVNGVIRNNLVKSSNMNTDTNADGVVDNFNSVNNLTATFSLNDSAQKISISNCAVNSNASYIKQGGYGDTATIPCTAGEVVSARTECKFTKAAGSPLARIALIFRDSAGTVLGTNYSTDIVSSTSGYVEIKVENKTAPANTAYVQLLCYIVTSATASTTPETADVWFKNALVEKASTVGNYITSGIKSTLSGRLKCISKNQLKSLEIGTIDNVTGLDTANTVTARSPFKKVFNSQYYYFKATTGYRIVRVFEYDSNKAFIRVTVIGLNSGSVQLSANTVYIRETWDKTSVTLTIDDLNAILSGSQIEKGTTATAYEPYADTTAYTQDLATKWDIFNVLTGVKTQGGNNKVLQVSDITGITQQTTNAYVVVGKPIDAISYGNVISSADSVLLDSFTSAPVNDDGTYYKISCRNVNTQFVISFPLGTTLAQAQAALVGKTISYQLAVPNYTYHPIGNLKAGALYTLINEPYIKDEGYYNSKVNIVAGAAKSIDWVNKIDVTNQVFTPVDITKVTLASDGLSFTITGAVTGDWYEYGAFPVDGNSTNPDVTAKASTSIGSSVDANTDAAILLTKETSTLRTENVLISQKVSDIELLHWMGV